MEVQSLGIQAKTNAMEKFMKLIEKYPDKEWNWKEISHNPNITMEIIDKYHDKHWEWNNGLSRNKNI